MDNNEPCRFKMLACEIFYREFSLLASQSEHIVDVTFIRKGLHDAGKEIMRQTIQDEINAVDKETYDAILLGYGRCSDGIVGLKANEIPIVVPRAHDCITLFFGSKEKYEKYFSQNPATYYRTTGWTERDNADDDSVMTQLGLNQTYEQYEEKYGPENAKYIMETIGWSSNYKYLTYIDLGLAIDDKYAYLAQQEAKEKKLKYKHIHGDWHLLRGLMAGQWDPEEFLVVSKGQTIASDDSGKIIIAVNDDK